MEKMKRKTNQQGIIKILRGKSLLQVDSSPILLMKKNKIFHLQTAALLKIHTLPFLRVSKKSKTKF
jgi:hypothetical protein